MNVKKLLIPLGLGSIVMVIVTWLLLILMQPSAFPVQNTFNKGMPTQGFDSLATLQKIQWTLLITGDIIPSRAVNSQMKAKNDFFWPLINIASVIQNADLTLINLEAPLTRECPVTTEGMTFCGDVRFIQSLSQAGVDVVNLANNHTLNYGWEGLAETEALLKEKGIATTGFSSRDLLCTNDTACSTFVTKEIENSRVGFLGFNGVGQQIDRIRVEKQIRQADADVDLLVVSVHWGKEYEREPVADPGLAPDDPNELGKLFIDWGADVVVGNHPHWYQKFERIKSKEGKDKLIFYALGNTVFDQEWSQETKRGFLARIHMVGDQIKTENEKPVVDLYPLGIRNFGEAYLLEGTEKVEMIEWLKK